MTAAPAEVLAPIVERALSEVAKATGIADRDHRAHQAQAVAAALVEELSARVEWGLRYRNLQDESVYIARDGRDSAMKAGVRGDVLVRRLVTDWTPEVRDE